MCSSKFANSIIHCISLATGRKGTELKLHLIEKLRKMKPVERGSSKFESGDWTMSETLAQKHVGGIIYFYETQAGDSYFGGTITGYRIIPTGEPNESKVVFEFIQDPAAKGYRTGKHGWGYALKSEA